MSKTSRLNKKIKTKIIKNKKFNMSEAELTFAFLENKLSWDSISQKDVDGINFNFIEKYKDKLNWKFIGQYSKLSSEFILKYINYINWDNVCMNGIIDDYIFDNYFLELFTNSNFCDIFYNDKNKITMNIIEKYLDYFGIDEWNAISQYTGLTDNFIEKHKNELNWTIMGKHKRLSENVIKSNINKVDFDTLCLSNVYFSSQFKKDVLTKRMSINKIMKELEHNNLVLFDLINIDNTNLWNRISAEYEFQSLNQILLYKNKLNYEYLKVNYFNRFNIVNYLNDINKIYEKGVNNNANKKANKY